MSKKKSPSQVAAIVSSMWVLFSLVSDLVRYMREFGCSIVEIGESFYALTLTKEQDTLKQIAKIISDVGQKARNIYLVAVDCSMSLADMIAAGKYDWVNSDIMAKNFPIEREVGANVPMRLFHFDKKMSTDTVKAEMDKEGWKPAKIWHLLFFGAKYPDLQKEFPIVALDSVWSCLVPCLGWNSVDGQRDLDLHELDHHWSGRCRFLATVSSPSASSTLKF